jgi:CheY-like chemotaxis protein
VNSPGFLCGHTQGIRAGASILIRPDFREDCVVTNVASKVKAPQKFLIVDDHAAFRQTVKDFLPGNPVEVIECGNGAEAVVAYNKHKPDWTLMDIQMPDMDGLKAIRFIRSENPKARVIILSQHDSADLREAAREAGAIAYVHKDKLKDLRGTISSLSQDSPINPNPGSSS